MPVEGETRVVGNGIGTYKMVNGKLVFRITSMTANKGKENDNMKKLREARKEKNVLPKMSPRSAKIAFQKFYKSEFYESEINKKKVVTKDIIDSGKLEKSIENQITQGRKVYKKRTKSPKYAKGSEEAKKIMERLREAKAKKREERLKAEKEQSDIQDNTVENSNEETNV